MRAVALLAAGYAALMLAWAFGTVPLSALDETAHYLRAISLGRGELIGDRAAYTSPEFPQLDAVQLEWVNRSTRAVTVPARHAPFGGECVGPSTGGSSCVDDADGTVRAKTWVGAYTPLPYALPGVLAARAENWQRGTWFGRVGAIVLFMLLVGAGLVALADARAGALALVGPLVALTPMALFVGAAINPNGTETAASFAFVGTLLRLVRDGPAPTWRVWLAVAATGGVLALTRTTAPLWLVLELVLVAALAGVAGGRRAIRAAPLAAAAAAVVVAAAIGANQAWEARHVGSARIDFTPLDESFSGGVAAFEHAMTELVGVYAAIVVWLPHVGYAAWWTMVALVLVLAAGLAPRRQALVLLAVVVAAAALPIVFYAGAYRHTGFGMSGRYFLPILVAVPLVAGELLAQHGRRLSPRVTRRLPVAFAVTAASVHFLAWYLTARYFAVGLDGPWWFLGRADWLPPLGWLPWVLLAGVGSLLLVAAAVVAGSPQPEQVVRSPP